MHKTCAREALVKTHILCRAGSQPFQANATASCLCEQAAAHAHTFAHIPSPKCKICDLCAFRTKHSHNAPFIQPLKLKQHKVLKKTRGTSHLGSSDIKKGCWSKRNSLAQLDLQAKHRSATI